MYGRVVTRALGFVVAGLCLAASASASTECPECDMSPIEIIQYWGYQVEEHLVTTSDGFTLTMYRMPAAQNQRVDTSVKVGKPPVLLVHALLDSCNAYIINLPHQSLAYILADNGYDVWLANSRGNDYSPPPCDSNDHCWDFSFDDMALYDVPAYLDYVLNSTGYKTLSYVGHSQGTIQLFAALSLNEELSKKINFFAAMGPVAYVKHCSSFAFDALAKLHVDDVVLLFGSGKFWPQTWLLKTFGETFCNGGIFSNACDDVLFSFYGFNSETGHDINGTRVQLYVAKTPAGTSTMNMGHWAQLMRQERFGMFDHGYFGNKAEYGTHDPPNYDLSKTKVPIAIFSGGQDLLSTPLDVARLVEELPQEYIVHEQVIESYNHLDFTWSLDAHALIYPKIMEFLKKYQDK